MSQIWNIARKELSDGLRNRWLLGGLAVSVLLQVVVLYAPPMNTLFHTVPLPPACPSALRPLRVCCAELPEGTALVRTRPPLRQ